MNLNKAIIIGRLTRDPELKSLPSGIKVTNFSVATNRVWKNEAGEKQEATDFHNVVVFGRQAETVAQYMRKGSLMLVEGRMQTRSWEQDGVKKYRTEIIAERTQFGPRSEAAAATTVDKGATKKEEEIDTIEYPEEDSKPEDIPF